MPSIDQSLERAVRHVSEGWLPPQQDVLETIQRGIASGQYERNPQQLAEDLKKDFSLFALCLRELSRAAGEQNPGEAGAAARSPLDLFTSAEPEKLKEIFDRSAADISQHRFSDISELQALRLKETAVSAGTAELLAASSQLEPSTGFACGLLRQLGLTLIAWNYPRVFARAAEKLSKGIPIDTSLRQVLGFSPSVLGVTLAQQWKLSDEILYTMGSAHHKPRSEHSLEAARRLAKICEVGEALARANNPEQYPTALSDWEFAQEQIAEKLGPRGIEKIFARVDSCLQGLSAQRPELFGPKDAVRLKEIIVDSRHGCDLFDNNTYLRKVPSELREDLRKLYAKFKFDRIIRSNVEILVREIIPKTGFRNGCIFMFEPALRALVPAIKIGTEMSRPCKPIKIHSTLANYNLIASAYSLKTPLREETINSRGEPVVTIAAAVGQFTPVGVLYLETTITDTNIIASSELMYIFGALRQSLADCLNVS